MGDGEVSDVLAKVIPVNTDAANGLQQYIPDILGAVFFCVIAALIWKYLPKPLIGVLLVLVIVLFFAFRGKH